MNRKRRANGNLYPLSFQDRRRRNDHRGSYKNHREEFPGLITTAAAESLSRGAPSPTVMEEFNAFVRLQRGERTRWEKIADWFRRTFGGSPIGGDRLL